MPMVIFLPGDFVTQNVFYFLKLHKMGSCNKKNTCKSMIFMAVQQLTLLITDRPVNQMMQKKIETLQ